MNNCGLVGDNRTRPECTKRTFTWTAKLFGTTQNRELRRTMIRIRCLTPARVLGQWHKHAGQCDGRSSGLLRWESLYFGKWVKCDIHTIPHQTHTRGAWTWRKPLPRNERETETGRWMMAMRRNFPFIWRRNMTGFKMTDSQYLSRKFRVAGTVWHLHRTWVNLGCTSWLGRNAFGCLWSLCRDAWLKQCRSTELMAVDLCDLMRDLDGYHCLVEY